MDHNPSPRHIRIEDYEYELPEEHIAKYPVAHRDESKLLIYNKGEISHDTFCNIGDYLTPGTLLVCNNTKVIQARLNFRKSTGAHIEVFLLEPAVPHEYELVFQTRQQCTWVCMIGNRKKWKEGNLSQMLTIGTQEVELTVSLADSGSQSPLCTFSWSGGVSFAEILESAGELPIPPYLGRATEDSDKRTYQTVYSKIDGSVAAPTAGLHFTPAVLHTLESRGIERAEVTLHVGAGTFRPVKSEEMEGHDMHREYISVSRETIRTLIAHGAVATAVGTTSVRTLESLYYIGCSLMGNPRLSEEELGIDNQWMPYDSPCDVPPVDALTAILRWMDDNGTDTLRTYTRIIIAPGYKYHIVRQLITNFHQPHSTLLLLVAAFIGEDWRKAYDYALDNGFRFLSYGDSSLLIPSGE